MVWGSGRERWGVMGSDWERWGAVGIVGKVEEEHCACCLSRQDGRDRRVEDLQPWREMPRISSKSMGGEAQWGRETRLLVRG